MSVSLSPNRLAQEAKSAYSQNQFIEAAASFKAAARAYQEMGDQLSAAEMLNNVCVSYLQAEQPEMALEAVTGTADIFAEAGDLRRQGIALGNLGSVFEALDRLDEAVQAYQQSGEILEQAGEEQLLLNVMQSLSAIQLKSGKQLDALITMQAGLENLKRPTPRQRFLKKLLKMPYKFIK